VIIMPVKFAKPQGASASDLEDLQALRFQGISGH